MGGREIVAQKVVVDSREVKYGDYRGKTEGDSGQGRYFD